jgi:hypothetical protein
MLIEIENRLKIIADYVICIIIDVIINSIIMS